MAGSVRIEVCAGVDDETARKLATNRKDFLEREGYKVVISQTRARTVKASVTAAADGSPAVSNGDPVATEGAWIVLAVMA